MGKLTMINENNGPKPISKIFLEFVESRNLTDRLAESSIPIYWKEVVGDVIASKAKVRKFEEGKLYINTKSSTWKAEILLRKESIIVSINKILGKELIKELVIK
jgi:predicted nucleic acid-binding Zn ribbon protein